MLRRGTRVTNFSFPEGVTMERRRADGLAQPERHWRTAATVHRLTSRAPSAAGRPARPEQARDRSGPSGRISGFEVRPRLGQ